MLNGFQGFLPMDINKIMIKHIFGPVPSRRLGISLGIDIVPFKTCSLDCIYCECGPTTQLAIKEEIFIEPDIIMEQLSRVLEHHDRIDHLTFSGSGEPTLHKGLGDIIRRIKKITHIPVAVLTNGTLLYRREIRNNLMEADIVLPSLDAVSPQVFQKINQPHAELDIQQIISGLIAFSKEYKGEIRLEVFIVGGINDSPEELEKLHHTILAIDPQRVQLNSLDRPPAYDNVEPVPYDLLEKITNQWQDLPVEIIKRIKQRREITSFSRNLENSILNTINRRPLMIEDLEQLTGKKRVELFKYIDILEKEKKIKSKIIDNNIFYSPTP